MKIAFALLVSLSLLGCQSETEVDRSKLLHSGNSKVWLLVEHDVNAEDQISQFRNEMIFLVLFSDGTCRSGLMGSFDDNGMVAKGKWELDDMGDVLSFQWEDQEKLGYQLLELNEGKIALQSEDGSVRLVFVPYFPPPAEVEGEPAIDPVIEPSAESEGGGTISIE